MPENPEYKYDRCAELGIKPSVPINAASPADVQKLIERIRSLEEQLASFTGAKQAAKSPV